MKKRVWLTGGTVVTVSAEDATYLSGEKWQTRKVSVIWPGMPVGLPVVLFRAAIVAIEV